MKSKCESWNGSDSATPSMTCIPLFLAIFPISLDGSSPNLIPSGAAKRPLPHTNLYTILPLDISSLMASSSDS